jgi:hypothetical protein
VGLVVVQHGTVSRNALDTLFRRSQALEQRLIEEFGRYQVDVHRPMIEIIPFGPISVHEAPPSAPGDTFLERLVHAYELWRFTTKVDERGQVPTHSFDSRIYVVADAPRAAGGLQVEGFSENGGRVGVARVELDESTVDLALFVAAHELFHTLGASDKYDASGRTLLPEGLPEPDRVPLFPQLGAEVMARNRAVSATEEAIPASLDELIVGRLTAQEIGWLN